MDNLDSLVEKVYLHFKDKKNKSYPMLSEKEEIKEALEKLISSPDSFYFIDEMIVKSKVYVVTTLLKKRSIYRLLFLQVLTTIKISLRRF